MDEFRENPTHNYALDDEFIKGLLHSRKGTDDAFYLLRLLYPNLNYGDEIQQDHMHPQSLFRDLEALRDLVPETDYEFAADPQNWDSVLNLQNLERSRNASKRDRPLAEWAAEWSIPNRELFVRDTTSLAIKDFKTFIEARQEVLLSEIRQLFRDMELKGK